VSGTGLCENAPGDRKKVTVTVNPVPTVTVTGAPTAAVCSGKKIENIALNGTATKYVWAVSHIDTATLLGLNDLSGAITASSGSGTLSFAGNTSNTGTAAKTVRITVTPYYTDACAGTPKDIWITVNPKPKMNNIPASASQTVCSGGAIAKVTFDTDITPSSLVSYSWSADGDWSNISSGSSTGNGDFPNFTAKENTSGSPYETTVTVTPKIGDCPVPGANKKTFTIRVNPKPAKGAIEGPPTVCVGSTVTLSNPAAPGGVWRSADESIATVTGGGVVTGVSAGDVDIWYKVTSSSNCSDSASYRVTVNPKPAKGEITGDKTVCVGNTVALSNPTATTGDGITSSWRSADESRATVDESGEVTGVSVGDVDIWYILTASSGCSDSTSYAITVKADNPDYPDIRLRICPSIGTVNLSKYIDTTNATVLWSSTNSLIQPDGDLNASNIHAPATYTFTYTVTTVCSPLPKTRKAYVTALRDDDSPRIRDTVRICYIRAKSVNVNQLFGLESGGTLTYDPDIEPHITKTLSGGIILNGTALYGSSYPGTVNVTFTYKPEYCLNGKEYTLVIVLTPDF
jgi:hypothetical protein